MLAEIVEENLELETIYLSHAHPDHYFGAEVLKVYFPKPGSSRFLRKRRS
jgi:glyoxylase-like metal-dependent hydrolase (beta-lactamase superfamily II)